MKVNETFVCNSFGDSINHNLGSFISASYASRGQKFTGWTKPFAAYCAMSVSETNTTRVEPLVVTEQQRALVGALASVFLSFVFYFGSKRTALTLLISFI